VKQHWLKVDFTRWADPIDAEDSEAEEQEWQKKMQDKMDLDLERELISAEAEQMLQKKNKDIRKDQYGRPEIGSLDSDSEDEADEGKEARPLSEKEIQDLDWETRLSFFSRAALGKPSLTDYTVQYFKLRGPSVDG